LQPKRLPHYQYIDGMEENISTIVLMSIPYFFMINSACEKNDTGLRPALSFHLLTTNAF